MGKNSKHLESITSPTHWISHLLPWVSLAPWEGPSWIHQAQTWKCKGLPILWGRPWAMEDWSWWANVSFFHPSSDVYSSQLLRRSRVVQPLLSSGGQLDSSPDIGFLLSLVVSQSKLPKCLRISFPRGPQANTTSWQTPTSLSWNSPLLSLLGYCIFSGFPCSFLTPLLACPL